jgi:uncharacterized repeat protein (TIGR03809 family)
MTDQIDVARGRDIVARWCAFAEQRLDYLTELFETGRWRRYHSEVAFLENIQEAKTAVEIWRGLATREASRNNTAIDLSWLGRSGAALPGENTHRVSVAAEAGHVSSYDAPSAPDSDPPTVDERRTNNVSELVPNLDAIEQRYPLLRNAL